MKEEQRLFQQCSFKVSITFSRQIIWEGYWGFTCGTLRSSVCFW